MGRLERANDQSLKAITMQMAKGMADLPARVNMDIDKIIPPLGVGRALNRGLQRFSRAAAATLAATAANILDPTAPIPASASKLPVAPACEVLTTRVNPDEAQLLDGRTALAFQEITGDGPTAIKNAPTLLIGSDLKETMSTQVATGAAKAAIFRYQPDTRTGAKPADCDLGTGEAIDALAGAVQTTFKTGNLVQVMRPVIDQNGQPTGKFTAVGTAPKAHIIPPVDSSSLNKTMKVKWDYSRNPSEEVEVGPNVCRVHLVGDSMVNPDNPITDQEGKNAIMFGELLTQELSKLKAGFEPRDVSVIETTGYLTGSHGAHSTINGVRAPVFFSHIDRWTSQTEQPDLGKVALLSLARNDSSQFVIDPEGFERDYFGILLRLDKDKKLKTIYAIGNTAYDSKAGPPHNLSENIPHIIAAQQRAIAKFEAYMRTQGRDTRVFYDSLQDFVPEDYEFNPLTGKREVHFSQQGVAKLAKRMVDATRQTVCLPDLPKQPTTIYLSSILNGVQNDESVKPIGDARRILESKGYTQNAGTPRGESWKK